MIKRNLMSLILALCLIGTSLAGADGLLPSLTDIIGKSMPSLGEALGRYPDDEVLNADGSNMEVFKGVTETDFNTFSIYLIEQGAALADYQIDSTSFSATIQEKDKTIFFTYDLQVLEATVTYPKGTYDEWLDYAKKQFASFVQLLNEGKTSDALSVIFTIPDYSRFKPIVEYIEGNPELAEAVREVKLAPYKMVDSIVIFGSYPQTESGTDNTPIEWLVLNYDAINNRALIASLYGLDSKPFNTSATDVTWEYCTLRQWLNKDFLNQAFNNMEQDAILTTTVDNSESQGYAGVYGGCDTQDKIFLLSYSEANKYFGIQHWSVPGSENNTKARVAPTAYAIKQGAWTSSDYQTTDDKAAGYWWLRSSSSYESHAAFIKEGFLDFCLVSYDDTCIRPALWINLDSDIFKSLE